MGQPMDGSAGAGPSGQNSSKAVVRRQSMWSLEVHVWARREAKMATKRA
jgi:hypothetical protein